MFEENKKKALENFEKHLKEGRVDEELIEFLKEFNKKENYYTTSSCAGRIIILLDKGKKGESKIVAKWHREISFEEFIKNLILTINIF